MEAAFTFNESANAVGELILTHNPETREMLMAGIGGWPGMFSIREWVQNSTVNQGESTSAPPAMQWNTIGSNGDRRNIKSGKTYHVRASLRGSQVVLTVNGIQVISTQRRRSRRPDRSRPPAWPAAARVGPSEHQSCDRPRLGAARVHHPTRLEAGSCRRPRPR